MDELNSIVTAGLAARYDSLAASLRQLAGPLSDEEFWRKPFGFGNSFGHLVLHLTGNLNYYIGAQIAGTAYIRDRNREFTETRHLTKAETLKRFDEAVAIVLRTIRSQSVEDWARKYTARLEDDAGNRFNIVVRCLSHLHHHIGQMTYLCEELARAK